jgi:hypothetical protein
VTYFTGSLPFFVTTIKLPTVKPRWCDKLARAVRDGVDDVICEPATMHGATWRHYRRIVRSSRNGRARRGCCWKARARRLLPIHIELALVYEGRLDVKHANGQHKETAHDGKRRRVKGRRR